MEREAKQICNDAMPVDVTGNGAACPKHWYALRVRSCCERSVAKRIAALGFNTFVPVQKEIRHWSDRDKVVDRLIIPMLVFVQLTENDICLVRSLSFVYGFLSASHNSSVPVVIPDEQMENFQKMLSQKDAPVTLVNSCPYKKGDKVIIVRGAMQGVEGVVHFTPNGTAICVEIDMLGYACVKIDVSDVNKIN